MKLSADGKYRLFPDCANDATSGVTVALWDVNSRAPSPAYPNTAAFLQRYGSEIPTAAAGAATLPNWGGFRVAMLNHSGYKRITLLAAALPAGALAVSRVEQAISMDSPNLDVLVAMWEQVLAQIPVLNQPTSTEVNQWSALANAHHLPLTFGSDGKIKI